MVLNHTFYGANSWSSKGESTRQGNVSCSDGIVSLTVWHMAPPSCNHILDTPIASNFGRKNYVTLSSYRTPTIVTAWPASFWKRSGQVSSKSAPNSDTLWVHLLLDNHIPGMFLDDQCFKRLQLIQFPGIFQLIFSQLNRLKHYTGCII